MCGPPVDWLATANNRPIADDRGVFAMKYDNNFVQMLKLLLLLVCSLNIASVVIYFICEHCEHFSCVSKKL